MENNENFGDIKEDTSKSLFTNIYLDVLTLVYYLFKNLSKSCLFLGIWLLNARFENNSEKLRNRIAVKFLSKPMLIVSWVRALLGLMFCIILWDQYSNH